MCFLEPIFKSIDSKHNWRVYTRSLFLRRNSLHFYNTVSHDLYTPTNNQLFRKTNGAQSMNFSRNNSTVVAIIKDLNKHRWIKQTTGDNSPLITVLGSINKRTVMDIVSIGRSDITKAIRNAEPKSNITVSQKKIDKIHIASKNKRSGNVYAFIDENLNLPNSKRSPV